MCIRDRAEVVPLRAVVRVFPVNVYSVKSLFPGEGNELVRELPPFFCISRESRQPSVTVGHAQNDLAARRSAKVFKLVQAIQELLSLIHI